MDRVRLDKWLWAARFFKTRTLAGKACELGKVQVNGQHAKSARDIRVNDRLEIKNDGGTFQVEVLGVSEMRGPAPVAQHLYSETEASRAARQQLADERKLLPRIDTLTLPQGKLSKRDRRAVDRLRGRA